MPLRAPAGRLRDQNSAIFLDHFPESEPLPEDRKIEADITWE